MRHATEYAVTPEVVRLVRIVLLLSLSGIAVTRGIAYIQFQDLPHGLEIVSRLLPIWVFALVWLAAGSCGVVVAALQKRGPVVISALFTMFLIWGLGYAMAWVLSGWDTSDWIPASFYLFVAAIVNATGRLTPRTKGI